MFTKLLHAQARAALLLPNKIFSAAVRNDCTLLRDGGKNTLQPQRTRINKLLADMQFETEARQWK